MQSKFWRRTKLVGLLAFVACAASAQPVPPLSWNVSASGNLYFPQVVFGKDASNVEWTSRMVLYNPQGISNLVNIYFYGQNGQAMTVNLNGESNTRFQISLDPGASQVLLTPQNGSAFTQGYAVILGYGPVDASLSYSQYINGTLKTSLAVPPVQRTIDFATPVTGSTGIALANPGSSDVTVTGSLALPDGQNELARKTFTIPAGGQITFGVGAQFNLGGNDPGALVLYSNGDAFLPVAIAADANNNLYSLPDGRSYRPASILDQAESVFYHMVNTAIAANYLPSDTNTQLIFGSTGDKGITISQDPNNKTVTVSLGALQLFGDSIQETAYILGHSLGHVLRGQNGGRLFTDDAELDADMAAMFLMLYSNYDVYAGSAALGTLAMATNQGLITTWEGFPAATFNTSVNTRLGVFNTTLGNVCALNNSIQQQCSYYKSLLHPNFPDNAIYSQKQQGDSQIQTLSPSVSRAQALEQLRLNTGRTLDTKRAATRGRASNIGAR